MFEWLKTSVLGKKPVKVEAKTPRAGSSYIKVDSRQYDLVNLSAKGFIAADFDGSLAVGQGVTLTVVVNDSWGKFNFAARCTVNSTGANNQWKSSFGMLAPEIEHVLAQYTKNRNATPTSKRS
ncbi:MAG: hypothetical protein WCK65_10030 [Rhodospirillaceae bacterium]